MTLHRYLYCLNNPANANDLTGEYSTAIELTLSVAEAGAFRTIMLNTVFNAMEKGLDFGRTMEFYMERQSWFQNL